MSSDDYQNLNWVLTGLAGLMTLGRYLLRGLSMRRFHWDDAAHLLSFLLLVIHGATNQVTADAKAQLAIDEKPTSHTSSNTLLNQYHHVYQLNTANNVLLYLVFWVVKVTFLMFYRMLFGASPRFMKVWWVVFIFTVLTYFIPFGGVIATCFGETTLAGYKECNTSNLARTIKLEYSCAFNVATDVFIMALPLWMIHDLKMKFRQKLALAFIFSLAVFCIALDILRVVEAVAENQALYTVLEINMVVIISCLPTYSSLLSIGERMRRKPSYPLYDSNSRPSQRLGSKGAAVPLASVGSTRTWDKQDPRPASVGLAQKTSGTAWTGTHYVDGHMQRDDESSPDVTGLPIQRDLSPEEAAHISH